MTGGVKKIFTLSSLGQQRGRIAGNSLVSWFCGFRPSFKQGDQAAPSRAWSSHGMEVLAERGHVGQTLAIDPIV
jgi:hypothetical protein